MCGGREKSVDVWTVEDEALQTETFNGKPIVNINSQELTQADSRDLSNIAFMVSEPEVREGWTGHTYGPPHEPRPGEAPPVYVRLDDPDPVTFGKDDHYRYLYDSKIAPAVVKAFHGLLKHEGLPTLDTLVLGQWGGRYTDSTDLDDLVGLLVEYEESFPNLKALFVGAVSTEVLDIHDIPIPKMCFLLNYFTQLESFKARGAPNPPNQADPVGFQPPAHLKTFFEVPIQHDNLKQLVIETADMDAQTIENLSKSKLPKLEHLELWFGEVGYYYYDESEAGGVLKSTEALLKNSFPSLRYLGLRNSSCADEMAIMLADLPILGQIEVLDLSLGMLSDIGANALVNSPYIGRLKKLIFNHNQVQDMGLIRQLSAKVPQVESANKRYMSTGVFVFE